MAEVRKEAIEYFNWTQAPNLWLSQRRADINKRRDELRRLWPDYNNEYDALMQEWRDLADIESWKKNWSDVYSVQPWIEYAFIAWKWSDKLKEWQPYLWKYDEYWYITIKDLMNNWAPIEFTEGEREWESNVANFIDMVKTYSDNRHKGIAKINSHTKINSWRKLQNKPGEWKLRSAEGLENERINFFLRVKPRR